MLNAKNPTRPRLRTGVLAVTLALLLAGCVAPKEQTTPPQDSEPTSDAPGLAGGIEGFYDQEVVWSGCEDGAEYECATVKAPLDWDDPDAATIDLAVKRLPAQGAAADRIGSLILNPGGPGGSGVDYLSYAVSSTLGEDVLAAFDAVSFDPRGVGQSSAVSCGDDSVLEEFFTTDVPLESQEDVDAAREKVRAFGEVCSAETGPLLGEVDTVSSARDLDLLRAVLGDDELYYAGFSYGTFLGATYAELFPQNVGRLLLDGALDPSMSNDDLVIGQAIGFENALTAYVADCQAGRGCPLTGTVDDGLAQIAALMERAYRTPLDAGDGNVVNRTMAFHGLVVTLYDDTYWPLLTMALAEALQDNQGTVLLELANAYLERTPEGEYLSNMMIAFTAINCVDYPTEERDYEEMVLFAKEIEAVAPTFGRSFGMAVGCEEWPVRSEVVRAPIAASGAEPILVVGTTGDPATPYAWSVALAEQLESGVLVSWEGEGHTAYGRSNECVSGAVEDYLVRGVVPQDGLTC
ncbi:alpha/beta hydrolase [Actinotalea sp. K2]|uniref:alpha/beta hydrolase n=1 Tax=Actinotalea sp. K2 TaxID=2939438 RepID=UPI0020174E51|nr:alpha/beta hydrolase [Actinotalea sp. K2]MCL3861393.1 alpha/beta hydrolase [Actinotalea sp. K2]